MSGKKIPGRGRARKLSTRSRALRIATVTSYAFRTALLSSFSSSSEPQSADKDVSDMSYHLPLRGIHPKCRLRVTRDVGIEPHWRLFAYDDVENPRFHNYATRWNVRQRRWLLPSRNVVSVSGSMNPAEILFDSSASNSKDVICSKNCILFTKQTIPIYAEQDYSENNLVSRFKNLREPRINRVGDVVVCRMNEQTGSGIASPSFRRELLLRPNETATAR